MSLAENIRRTGVLPGELAVCWLGQAGFLLKDCQGKVLVIDPYLSNCGEQMRGFKRLSPILLAPEELTPDYYLITHLHFDHFDYETVPKILERGTSPLFLGPSSCREKLLELGRKVFSEVKEEIRPEAQRVITTHMGSFDRYLQQCIEDAVLKVKQNGSFPALLEGAVVERGPAAAAPEAAGDPDA